MSAYTAFDQERGSGNTDTDFRNHFARDRDRILYSSAFRRLAGKTQVVAAGELGDFHNRMTHSLKVGQLGRRLAEYLRDTYALDDGRAPDPELIEAACLAHDLGHPPFGHAGESALRQVADEIVLKRDGNEETVHDAEATREILNKFGGFEGNAQTLRILIRLAARYPVEAQGLDLTRATLDSTIKYPWLRGDGDREDKWNVYPDDREYAEWIRGTNGLGPGAKKSVESQLMDWCDDVAYACHDLQDFYRAGIVPLEEIFRFELIQGKTSQRVSPTPAALDVAEALKDNHAMVRIGYGIDQILDAMVKLSTLVLVGRPYDGGRETKAAMHQSTSALITYFLGEVKVKRGAVARYAGEIEIDPAVVAQVEILKELIWVYVIRQPALQSQQTGQQRVLKDLVHIFYDGGNGNRSLLPLDRLEDLDRGVDFLRCCIDHVASMSETAALALHQRLTGAHIGHYTDGSWRI